MQIIIACLITYALGIGTATAVCHYNFIRYKNREGIKYHHFEKKAKAFKSLIFDGEEYIPRKWYDKACHALFKKGETS